jgi:hypothetical protein
VEIPSRIQGFAAARGRKLSVRAGDLPGSGPQA